MRAFFYQHKFLTFKSLLTTDPGLQIRPKKKNAVVSVFWQIFVAIFSHYIHNLVYDRKSLRLPTMVYENLNATANLYLSA